MTVDLQILKFRHKFTKALRDFFDEQDFLEVETPILIASNTPDPHIDPILACLSNPVKQVRQLHTSPELWLKKSLALGAQKVYQLGKVFRDDPPGPAHVKEFTMIEWYRTEATLAKLVEDCQEIFAMARKSLPGNCGSTLAPFQSFLHQSVSEVFLKYAKIDLSRALYEIDSGNPLYLNNLLKDRGDLLPASSSFIDAFFLVMLKYIEPSLPPHIPVVISRWPVQLAALAAPCPDNALFCDRFEIYYQGLEIANAYEECFDPRVLGDRFEKENQERKALGKQEFIIDAEFFKMTSKLPATAGIALGVDRLLMAVTGKKHLKDLIWGNQDQEI